MSIGKALLGKAGQLSELYQSNCRLDFCHAQIVPHRGMVVAFLLPVAAQQTHLFSNGRIVGGDHATFASCHVSSRIERETAGAKATNGLAIYCCSMCLAGI